MTLSKSTLQMFTAGLIIGGFAVYSYSGAGSWNPPPTTPLPNTPPNNNVDMPINVGGSAQTKTGDLTVSTNINTTNLSSSWSSNTKFNIATNQMRSDKYCNFDGSICNSVTGSANQWRNYYPGTVNGSTGVPNKAFCMVEQFQNGGCDTGFQAQIYQHGDGYWHVNQVDHGDCDRTPWAVYACIGL